MFHWKCWISLSAAKHYFALSALRWWNNFHHTEHRKRCKIKRPTERYVGDFYECFDCTHNFCIYVYCIQIVCIFVIFIICNLKTYLIVFSLWDRNPDDYCQYCLLFNDRYLHVSLHLDCDSSTRSINRICVSIVNKLFFLSFVNFVKTLIETIIDLVQSFDLTWKDSIETISVLSLACEFLGIAHLEKKVNSFSS